MNKCLSETQLDCIEAVNGIEGEKVIPGVWKEYKVIKPWTDSRGNSIEEINQFWEVPYAAGPLTFRINPSVETPNYIINEQGKRAAAMRILVFEDTENLEAKVQLVVRTSWLKPGAVGLAADNADFKVAKIGGGNRWTFKGTRAQTFGYTTDWWGKYNTNAFADTKGSQLYFIVDHSGTSNETSWWDISCDSKGFTTTSSNATMAGQPFWDSGKQSLNFNMYGPHLDTAGKRNKGFFRFWASTAYLKCRWPQSNLGETNQFTVGVYNEDGTKQIATTVASVKDGVLKVEAFNFHYSSPTIRLSAAKTTITCVNKAKKTKKVSALKPTCPTGYKIKK